jgi:hypothetical protein
MRGLPLKPRISHRCVEVKRVLLYFGGNDKGYWDFPTTSGRIDQPATYPRQADVAFSYPLL